MDYLNKIDIPCGNKNGEIRGNISGISHVSYIGKQFAKNQVRILCTINQANV